MKSETLISDLIERTKNNLNRVQNFQDLTDQELNHKISPQSWSILECLEHLNRYGDFYIPELKEKIKSSHHKNNGSFKSGWLGNYFAKMILPKEKLNKMKTLKSMNPVGSKLNRQVIEKFIRQQQQLLELLDQARDVSLTKTKTKISISSWIRLRLGDTFRFVIYHNQRHILQAENILSFS